MGLNITGGILKGRKVCVLSIKGFRYTSSKVRESIFSMIGDISDLKILELFAGSGVFSLEAISRGARSSTLVEKNEKMAELIKKNISLLGVEKKCSVLRMDVYHAIPFLYKMGNKYDIIFLDPPYDMGHVNGTLMKLKKHPLYTDGSVIIVEHSKREIPQMNGQTETLTKKYGDTCVTILWMKGAN